MTQVTDATVRARALALSDKILSHTIERGGLSRSDLINALVVVLAHERKVGFAKGLEEAAKAVDQCNLEGPYHAIGAASRIRALFDPPDSKRPGTPEDDGTRQGGTEM